MNQIDKIYIPTLGRHLNQLTWIYLPNFIRPLVQFVVQPKEQHLFVDKPHIVLPSDDIGMSNTRRWIYELGHNQIYGVFDDDLRFMKRNTEGKPSKIGMTDEDWKTVISGILEWLDNDCSFAGFRRSNLPPKLNEYDDNKESLQAIFYNGRKLPKVNELEWTPEQYAEDTKLHLQLILQGHKNRVWNLYGMDSKQFTEGGCSSDTSISPNGRTPEDIDKSHQHLVDVYYPFAQYRTKRNGHIVRHDDAYRKIKIKWGKAYKHSQTDEQGTLSSFL